MVLNNYCIGDLTFKSKKQCKNDTRDIINKLGCCVIDKDHIYIYIYNNLFDNLLKNHSEYEIKKCVGIACFIIRNDPIVKKAYQMSIDRIDNSSIIFSWVYCCQFKPRTISQILDSAMRNTISIDTIQYKQSQDELICNYCKTTNEPYENYRVDHDNPSFKTLQNDFLQTTNKHTNIMWKMRDEQFTMF